MTRRDTIIIATLVNMVLLATLFITSSREEPSPLNQGAQPIAVGESSAPFTDHNQEIASLDYEETPPDIEAALLEVLQEGNSISTDNPLAFVEEGLDKELDPVPVVPPPTPPSPPPAKPKESVPAAPKQNFLEIKVKRGDALEKIARQYGSTVKEIRELNHLTSDSLKIGQTLKVPESGKKIITLQTDTKPVPAVNKDELWVVVKSGDSPWKIAKQYGVSYADVLRLNNLTEEKAKTLKIGDRIRVK